MNKYPNIIFIVVIFLLINGCATKEEIKRRELLKKLAIEMQSGQTNNSNTFVKIQTLEERINLLNGDIEELKHSSGQSLIKSSNTLEQRINLLTTDVEEIKKNMELQKTEVMNQQKYLKKILASLKKISTPPIAPYDLAMKNYKAGKYSKAKQGMLELLNDKQFKGKKRARIIHNLGMISFIKKKYPDALTYFSNLYTKYPKVSYNANGLLYLSKTFKKLKKSVEEEHTLNELISKFPKTNSAKKAKQILKKIKK